MALKDLTPQLRTRLSRVERLVGLFVTLALLVLVVGFSYYIYHTAVRRGWFLEKVQYSTSLNNATGLRVGDPVKLMGFNVGAITRIEANAPEEYYGVTIYFRLNDPYYGYLWTDSRVRVAAADFLGNRSIEIIKGRAGIPTVQVTNNEVVGILDRELVKKEIQTRIEQRLQAGGKRDTDAIQVEVQQEMNQQVKLFPSLYYTPILKAKPYWVEPSESPALTDRLESLVSSAEEALPGILALTNQISAVLSNTALVTSNFSVVATRVQPVVTNLEVITGHLLNPRGSLGEWLIPTNLNVQLDRTLSSANQTLLSTDTNVTSLVSNLNRTVDELAGITSNLHRQVDDNTNLVSGISRTIINADSFVQGLKRHWLLRSAFREPRPPRPKEEWREPLLPSPGRRGQ